MSLFSRRRIRGCGKNCGGIPPERLFEKALTTTGREVCDSPIDATALGRGVSRLWLWNRVRPDQDATGSSGARSRLLLHNTRQEVGMPPTESTGISNPTCSKDTGPTPRARGEWGQGGLPQVVRA